jgi:hypothetical protein
MTHKKLQRFSYYYLLYNDMQDFFKSELHEIQVWLNFIAIFL